MILTNEELTFCLQCCNEVLRGFKIKPSFETIFPGNGEADINLLEMKLIANNQKINTPTIKIQMDNVEIANLIKVVSITSHELDWELPIRTNLDRFAVEKLMVKLMSVNLA